MYFWLFIGYFPILRSLLKPFIATQVLCLLDTHFFASLFCTAGVLRWNNAWAWQSAKLPDSETKEGT